MLFGGAFGAMANTLSITLGFVAGVCCRSEGVISYLHKRHCGITEAIRHILVIVETGIIICGPAAATQVRVFSSLDRIRMPSFFLYEATPLRGAIVACLDRFHCPG